MNIIIVGPPGAGKGTQAKKIAKEFNLVHISTGDILRDQMEQKTEIGLAINDLMNAGQYVSDDIIIPLLRDRLLEDDCKNGTVLDGYPRNIYQAERIDETVSEITAVVDIEVDDEHIIARMSGRRSCPDCGKVYNILYYPPKKENICDDCGAELMTRPDDAPEIVKERLETYRERTNPVIEFFRQRGKVITVDGTQKIDDITRSIVASIKAN